MRQTLLLLGCRQGRRVCLLLLLLLPSMLLPLLPTQALSMLCSMLLLLGLLCRAGERRRVPRRGMHALLPALLLLAEQLLLLLAPPLLISVPPRLGPPLRVPLHILEQLLRSGENVAAERWHFASVVLRCFLARQAPCTEPHMSG